MDSCLSRRFQAGPPAHEPLTLIGALVLLLPWQQPPDDLKERRRSQAYVDAHEGAIAFGLRVAATAEQDAVACHGDALLTHGANHTGANATTEGNGAFAGTSR